MSWFLTTDGFYSAVAHKTDPQLLTIRCRHLVDAEYLASFFEAHHLSTTGETKHFEPIAYRAADYPWRVFAPKTYYAAFAAHQVMAIDYGNFKDEVTRKQGHARHDTYSAVWGTLLRIEREPGAKRGHAAAADRAERAGVRRPGWGPPAAAPRETLGRVGGGMDHFDDVRRDSMGRRRCEDCGRMLGYWNAELCDRCEYDLEANEDLEPVTAEAKAVEMVAAEQMHLPHSPFFVGAHVTGDGCELDDVAPL